VNIVVLTPVRVLGDGIAACIGARAGYWVRAVVRDLAHLRDALASDPIDLILIDVTQGIDLYDVREIVVEHPTVSLVALGLTEQRHEVIRCGRAGFTGYVSRDVGADGLCTALADVIEGRLACPAEISSGLLRALFKKDAGPEPDVAGSDLTRREMEVLQLVGKGLSNKEIAHALSLSVATVKHHMHHLLGKLGIARRAQAMQRVRDAPWIASIGRTAPVPKTEGGGSR
jgi:DNA-binding NarL/FixJ family response regulator